MTSFDPASNQHPLLVQPTIPNPVPWLATPEPAGLALVSEPMALTPLAWATPSDLPTPTPFNGQIAALGAPADPVTGLAATQATATSGATETFSNGSSGWTTASGAAAPIATNPAYGSFMGPFANGSKANGQDVWKTFDLQSLGGKISFDFYRFDTWDQETFKVYANDVNILSSTFGWENNVTQARTGSANGYSWTITPVNDYTVRPEWNALTRQSFRVTITAPSGVGTLKLGFGSDLNEAADNESYGIDNVSFMPMETFAIPLEDFSNGSSGWKEPGGGDFPVATSTNSAYGSFMGPFSNGPRFKPEEPWAWGGQQDVFKNYSFSGFGGTISFDFLRIDSWDNEEFLVFVNDQVVLESSFRWGQNVTTARTGAQNGYVWTITPIDPLTSSGNGGEVWRDQQRFHVMITAPTGLTDFKLGFGSFLAQGTADECYGIDNVSVVSNSRDAWTAASGAVPMGSDPAFGSFMGPFAYGPKVAGQDVWKTFDLPSTGGTISFDFLRMDTWDGESFKVFANDTEILSSAFFYNDNVTTVRTGSSNGYGWTITPVNDYRQGGRVNGWTQQSFRVRIDVPSGVTTLKLGFGSTLDQAATDESYGIDNVSVTPLADGWIAASGVVPIGRDASLGSFIGPFANGSKVNGQDVWQTYSLSNYGNTYSFDFLRMDTWDGESFKVFANDAEVLSSAFLHNDNVTTVRAGRANGFSWTITPVNDYRQGGRVNGWTQQSFRVTITDLRAGGGALKLGFGSTLDQPVNDESYGIGSVSVGFANPIYDNDFENNANGFTTQWRDGGIGAQGTYVGRFGYNSGTSLTVGRGSSYALNQDKDTTIGYDYLRLDDWNGQVMNFGVSLNYNDGAGFGPQTARLVLSKSFDKGRREGSFDLEGQFTYNYVVSVDFNSESLSGVIQTRVGSIKMHFESYMYGNFGFGSANDEAFRVSLTVSSLSVRNYIPYSYPQVKIGSSVGLDWWADSNRNSARRSWGIDNMLITQAPDPVTTVASVASVSTQPMPNAFVASNPTPIVGSSVVVSPLATPVLAPTGDPASFMGLTPDSALAPTSDAKAAARLKPISYWAGLKNSHVAKRLLGLQAAR